MRASNDLSCIRVVVPAVTASVGEGAGEAISVLGSSRGRSITRRGRSKADLGVRAGSPGIRRRPGVSPRGMPWSPSLGQGRLMGQAAADPLPNVNAMLYAAEWGAPGHLPRVALGAGRTRSFRPSRHPSSSDCILPTERQRTGNQSGPAFGGYVRCPPMVRRRGGTLSRMGRSEGMPSP
jgi:hypothetical protein